MAINLRKGERIEVPLRKVKFGLGWKPNERVSKFPFDLDAECFMLGEDGKLPKDEYFVFYNNKLSFDGAVEAGDDDLEGGSGAADGDDEAILVDLDKVNDEIKELLFTVSIYEYDVRKQNFGQIDNSYIRILNAETEEVIAQYDLTEEFSGESAVEFGRLYRYNGKWKFKAEGSGYRNGLQELVDKYVKP